MKVKGSVTQNKRVSENSVYEIMNHAVSVSKSLEPFIEPLLGQINDNKQKNGWGLVFEKMNDQQIMAQIQQKLKKHLRSVKKDLKRQGIEQQQMQEMQEQLSDQAMNEQLNSQESQEMDVQDQEGDQEDEQQIEQNEEELEQNEAIEEVSQQYDGSQQNMQNELMQEDQGQPNEEQIDNQMDDSQAIEGQDDVGLYGEELDQEDMESYQNELDKEGLDPQFQRIANQLNKNQRKSHKREKDEQSQGNQMDDAIEDNFDQYREIQLKNQQQTAQVQKTDMDKKIDQLQDRFNKKKDWALLGQVKARERPVNSLLQYDLKFNSGIKLNHQVTIEMNNDLEALIKQRVLDELFDDRVRYTSTNALREHFGSSKDINIDTEKSKKGLAELYEEEFKNYLGLGENKHDKLKKEIMDQFKELNYKLDCLSNFNFIPRPVVEKSKANKGSSDTIVVEEKVPITMWNGQNQDAIANRGVSKKFIAEKEVDNQAKRLKNKRIARQRNKQQMQKKMNRKIQYGGMTKSEAQARQKIMKNKQNAPKIKYNKSASFFKSMNEKASGKPNPNINKMKI